MLGRSGGSEEVGAVGNGCGRWGVVGVWGRVKGVKGEWEGVMLKDCRRL